MLSNTGNGKVSVEIFDIRGRLIRSFDIEKTISSLLYFETFSYASAQW